MKKILLLFLAMSFYKVYTTGNSPNCTGNACAVVIAKADPFPNIPWQFVNNSNKTVSLGIRSFSGGGCSNTLTYVIKPHGSLNWGISRQTYCLPYEANFK